MADDLYLIVVGVGVLIPILGTLLGWHQEAAWARRIRESAGRCPACGHPGHWPWCRVRVEAGRMCWCDLFTEPSDAG